jgi:hypothetical protein
VAPALAEATEVEATEAKKNKARASKTILPGGKCNSNDMKELMEQYIVEDDANEVKKLIHST